MANLWFALACFISFSVFVSSTSDEISDEEKLPPCKMSDFHYEYTACDSEGGRWRVSVPNPDTCVGGQPPAPVRGQDCDFTCDAGEYLDIVTDQECHLCPAGYYSLGGGILYTNWSFVPVGFTTRIESFSSSDDGDNEQCKEVGWTPNGKYIVANNTACLASLGFSATLVRPGSVTFSYRFVDSDQNSMFSIEIQNGQCQTHNEKVKSNLLETTETDEWKVEKQPLKEGVNIIYWRVFPVLASPTKTNRAQKFVAIQSIAISGVAYTSNCTECEAGTFSAEGASTCDPCPENTYSGRGATKCIPCNEATEYSGPGSAKCLRKPACTQDHYIMYYSQCIAGNTRKKYKWIEPKLCTGGVALPVDGEMEPCPPCNVGMHPVNGTCEFCKQNEYSDGLACKACPGSTTPESAVVYKRWTNLPVNANVTTRCMSLHDNSLGCLSKDGWTMYDDYIQTVAINADDTFLVVSVDVGGFRAGEGSSDNSEVSFLFDTVCSADCEFLFFMQEGREKTQLIEIFNGPLNHRAYRLPFSSESSVKFTWAFRKSQISGHFDLKTDHAKIYVVNITNTISGGAEKCRRCPRGASSSGCIPCPPGHYIDPDESACKACPSGTVVLSRSSWGKESCVKCGNGLVPYNGQRCVSYCTFSSSDGSLYNFTELARTLHVQGPRLFTPTGHAYNHFFNISLCGNNGIHELAYCGHNLTSSSAFGSNSDTAVRAYVCQNTILLSQDPTEPIVSVSPISLGSELIGVTDVRDENITKLLSAAGIMPENNNTQDVYMKYISQTPTAACRNGRTTTVVLRCTSKDDQQTGIELPKLCGDGTCDGCNFIFIIKSQLACPLCHEKDIQTYTTRCAYGKMSRVFEMKKSCNLQGKSLTSTVESCNEYWQDQWPLWLKIVIILVPVVLLSGFLLLSVVIFCWIKNKNLQYKYMKLIESSNGKYSEMPAPEVCALDEGEDEEEHFDVVKIRKGTKFFSKFKLPQKRGGRKGDDDDDDDDDESFESMRMTHKTSMT